VVKTCTKVFTYETQHEETILVVSPERYWKIPCVFSKCLHHFYQHVCTMKQQCKQPHCCISVAEIQWCNIYKDESYTQLHNAAKCIALFTW